MLGMVYFLNWLIELQGVGVVYLALGDRPAPGAQPYAG